MLEGKNSPSHPVNDSFIKWRVALSVIPFLAINMD